MDVYGAIRMRSSCRAFLPTPVAKDVVEEILEVARFAPSGVNSQPWRVAVVSGDTLARIYAALVDARERDLPSQPDYAYYPEQWEEPYASRRRACGLALYQALAVGRDDPDGRKEAWYRNYAFFGAPVGLLYFVDKCLAIGSLVDYGMFLQNVMLAAQAKGLATCAQAALAEYPGLVRQILGIPPNYRLVCGMSLGYPDLAQPVNRYRLDREPVSAFTTWYD
jgi:nitroreductase